MHFALSDQYGHAILHKNPSPGGGEIYNFDRLFLAHYYHIVTFSARCPGVEKKMFEEIHFPPKKLRLLKMKGS